MSTAQENIVERAAAGGWQLGEGFAHSSAAGRSSGRHAHSRRLSLRAVRLISLIATDTLAVVLSIAAAYVVSEVVRAVVLPGVHSQYQSGLRAEACLVFVIPSLLLYWKSWAWGHYTRFRPVWTELRETLQLSMYAGAACAVMLYALKLEFSRLWLGFFLVLLCILVPLGRAVSKRVMMHAGVWLTPTYVVGVGDNAAMTAAALDSDTSMGHDVQGFLDLSSLASQPSISGKPVLSRLPSSGAAQRGEPPHLVFAFESLDEMNRYRSVLNGYIADTAAVTVAPPINGLPLCGAEVISVFRHDTILLKLQNNIHGWRARSVKRAFDLAIAGIALALLAPLMLFIYWLIGRDGGNPIYSHRRVGKGGREFECLKFRSMIVNSNEILARHLAANPDRRQEWGETHKLRDDPRITTLGRILRKSSLDELPQLINVLRGEMSIVGPRPIVTDEMSKYGEYLPYYLSMTPGITGLWQSSGRSDTTYRERVLLDVWYARNWSAWHDLVIILRTVPSLLGSLGAR